jgi:acyl carrier protein
MNRSIIEQTVIQTISDYCSSENIDIAINFETPLIGSNRILDSMGLVNIIVDIETAFMEQNIEVTLTSESAMSSRISPFRNVASLCNFILNQLKIYE